MRFWARPSWEWAYIWALVIVVAPSVVLAALNWRDESGGPRKRWLLGLVQGADNRWSTSKTAIVLWTFAVWWTLLAMLIHTHGDGFADQALEGQYLLLLGIPTTAAVAAKATHKGHKLTTTKPAHKVNPRIEKSKLAAPTVDVVAGVGQLFADDTGMPDLLDSQYFGFTIILLLWFVTQFVANSGAGLPVLPQTLVGLSGVSAAGYAVKKALPPMDGTTPTPT